jgi:hypothetical protein
MRSFKEDIILNAILIIEFSHRMILIDLGASSLDYAEQFLFDFYTHLPCPNTWYIAYELLLFATQQFTVNAAHANCSKVQHILVDSTPMIYPESVHRLLSFVVIEPESLIWCLSKHVYSGHFYLYFSSLKLYVSYTKYFQNHICS